jgi:cytochrome c5
MKSIVLLLMLLTTSVHAASHHPEDFLHSIQGSKTQGQKIYQHFCSNCHALKPLIPLGAPRLRQKNDWVKRLKHGMPSLIKNTQEGLNAMPARGGCFECTDEQLLAAIEYLLPRQK